LLRALPQIQQIASLLGFKAFREKSKRKLKLPVLITDHFITSSPVSMLQLISGPFRLDVDDTPIVLLPVYLTLVTSIVFKESCIQLLERNVLSKTMILDFRQNTFIDGSGIGTLVTLYKAARSQGIDLILRNVTPQAMMVLELSQLDKIFTIYQQLCQ
jgi:anti-anti-sigma factor